jgi:hypothetical protein
MTNDHLAELNLLLNFALNARKMQKLILHEKYKDFEPRLYPHIGLQAPASSQKSQLLGAIGDIIKCDVHHDITYPNLVGSISKDTKQLLPAAIWQARKGVLLLDEFNQDEKGKVLRALLPIMEDEYYSRSLGLFCVPSKVGNKDCFMRVKDGRIEIKVKLPVMFATMHNYMMSTAVEIYAMLQRCIWYDYQLSDRERIDTMQGNPPFEYEPVDVLKCVEIDKADYTRILNYAFKNIHHNVIERGTLDLCRAFAVYGWNNQLFELIVKCKNMVEERRETAIAENTRRASGGHGRSMQNLRPREREG